MDNSRERRLPDLYPARIPLRLDDLEYSDMGRDPMFRNGRWLGLAIVIAGALGAVYIGFFSVWAALALAVVW